MTRWIVASLHLLALAVGTAAIALRTRALRQVRDQSGVKTILMADNWWGIAALLWLVTGLWRAFGGLEKGAAYYLGNPLFHAKLGLFVLILLLELWPMVTFIRWRIIQRRGGEVDLTHTRSFARTSSIQLMLVLAIVFFATAIARGLGG